MRVKTPEQLAIQKAIICLYLRYRRARKYLREAYSIEFSHNDNWRARRQLDMAREQENEARNALESVKRVLWLNDWS